MFIFGLLVSMTENSLLTTILQAKGSNGAVDFVCECGGRCSGAGNLGEKQLGWAKGKSRMVTYITSTLRLCAAP